MRESLSVIYGSSRLADGVIELMSYLCGDLLNFFKREFLKVSLYKDTLHSSLHSEVIFLVGLEVK